MGRRTAEFALTLLPTLGLACGGSSQTPFGLDQRPPNATCLAPAPPTSAEDDPFPNTLRKTGCVDQLDPTKPTAGLIPYDVNAPLWSDGADKKRFLALPDGAQIHVNADDDWDLPAGSVLIKTFLLGGKRIETRLFMRHKNGQWAGYSYEWNDDQTDANLVHEGGKNKFIGAVDWTYPSRTDCMKCHTEPAGASLGLETAQLNGDFTYPNGRRSNQVTTLANIGMFDAPLRAPVASLPRLPDPLDAGATLDVRARAYLHGNCANCHRPGAIMDLKLDLRHTLNLSDTASCGIAPQKKDLGTGPDGRIITPGKPDLSLVIVRMESLNSNRMPPVASSIVDDSGVKLLRQWISALTVCP